MLKRVRNRGSKNSGSGIRPDQVHVRLCIYCCPTWDQLLPLVDDQLPPLENGNKPVMVPTKPLTILSLCSEEEPEDRRELEKAIFVRTK